MPSSNQHQFSISYAHNPLDLSERSDANREKGPREVRSRQWKREAFEGGQEREGFERGEVEREWSEARSRERSEVEREREREVCAIEVKRARVTSLRGGREREAIELD